MTEPTTSIMLWDKIPKYCS